MKASDLFNRWPQKLGALILAVFVWFSVNVNDTNISQRGLIVPLEIEGLSDNETASGYPSVVSVSISGPSNLVDNLRTERLNATLDLTDITGDYQQPIDILVPRGIELKEYTPQEVSGTVESVVTKTVSVQVALLGEGNIDDLLNPSFSSESVIVRGLNSVVERVTSVVGTAQSSEDEQTVQLFAVDEAGQPVTDASLSLEPATVTVELIETPVMHLKTVPIEIAQPEVAPFELGAFEPSQETLNVTGTKESLDDLTSVNGSVDVATAQLAAGEYTLEVVPELPEGVAALETVTAQLTLSAPPTPSDGDSNDSPNSTVRRPDSTQDGEPGDDIR